MKLAYDLGASFLWFWTSDRGHHVPYDQQLDLVRSIRQHIRTHPRPPAQELLSRAKTAIVLPYGYTLPGDNMVMFGSDAIGLDRQSHLGLTFRQVLAPAVKEVERCLKQTIPYDVVVAGQDFDPTVYDEVVWVREDATVRISRNRAPAPTRYE